jgi:hypothetical protein
VSVVASLALSAALPESTSQIRNHRLKAMAEWKAASHQLA